MQFMVDAMAAEMERELIRERTLDGLRAAQALGRLGGRPPAVDEDVLAVARARQARGESVTAIARHLKMAGRRCTGHCSRTRKARLPPQQSPASREARSGVTHDRHSSLGRASAAGDARPHQPAATVRPGHHADGLPERTLTRSTMDVDPRVVRSDANWLGW
jgi:hypothetical protein